LDGLNSPEDIQNVAAQAFSLLEEEYFSCGCGRSWYGKCCSRDRVNVCGLQQEELRVMVSIKKGELITPMALPVNFLGRSENRGTNSGIHLKK